MIYTTLPHTEIKVSKLCLGTMTWGNQNTQAEGFLQMDYALDHGINFWDTAEMYPVPASAETYSHTEQIIGEWIKKTGRRDDIVLASKIAGPGDYTAHIRTTGFPDALEDAVNQSLKRLNTDYLDLYQLHWPERHTNTFGIRDYKHTEEAWQDNFNEVLHRLDKIITSGKVRHIGISNEKAWGTMRFLEESKHSDLPRMLTIQNPYSLLNRTFEGDLAEISIRENLGLLAYSPMAFGVLSGKYIKGNDTVESRLNKFSRYTRYSSAQCSLATQKYMEIAEAHQLSFAQMSLAFVTQQPFVTSTIIGATHLEQLKENIDSIHLTLRAEVLEAIESVHKSIPNPAT